MSLEIFLSVGGLTTKAKYMMTVPPIKDMGAMNTAKAAISWALRFPPISRAIKPARIMATPWAMAGRTRRPRNDSPNNASPMRANKGVIGG